MDAWLEKNLDFAIKGLKEAQFVYTAEICKNILNTKPDCIKARQILQSASKSIYIGKSLIGKIFSQGVSISYLIIAFSVLKSKKLSLLQQALCYYPLGKIPLILLAQVGFEKGLLEIVLFVYKELYEIFPEDTTFALALGSTFLSSGNYESALKIGQEIIQKDPSNLDAMNLVEQAILGQIQIN